MPTREQVKNFLKVYGFALVLLCMTLSSVALLFRVGQLQWQNSQVNRALDRRTQELLASESQLKLMSESLSWRNRQAQFLCEQHGSNKK